MRAIRVGLLVVAIGVTAVAVVDGLAKGRTAAPHPPLVAVDRVDAHYVDPVADVTLDPPPPDMNPKVSAEDAESEAWSEEGAPGEPSSVEAKFGLLTMGKYDSVPVWVLTYQDVCVQGHGPGATDACRATTFHTFMDASSGEFIASYASSYDANPESGPQ